MMARMVAVWSERETALGLVRRRPASEALARAALTEELPDSSALSMHLRQEAAGPQRPIQRAALQSAYALATSASAAASSARTSLRWINRYAAGTRNTVTMVDE